MKLTKITSYLLLTFIGVSTFSCSQTNRTIAFYNVENLFDTKDDPNQDDQEFLNFVEKLTYKCATKVYPNSNGLKEIIIEKSDVR